MAMHFSLVKLFYLSLAFLLARKTDSLVTQYLANIKGIYQKTGKIGNPLYSSKASFDVVAKDFELTSPLSDRVRDKIGKVVNKLGHDAMSVNVVLRLHRTPTGEIHTSSNSQLNIDEDTEDAVINSGEKHAWHNGHKMASHVAEVTVAFKGGQVVHASERTEDMYASIDLVSHKIAQSIKKHNSKLRDKHQKSNPIHTDFSALPEEDTFDENELLEDLDEKFKTSVKKRNYGPLTIVRPKKFAMPPISVDDAIHHLQVIDHPFYAFRNKDSNEINVVYWRKDGGVGIIMPE